MSFDPAALRGLGGRPERRRQPATVAFLLRIGAASGVAAAGCNLLVRAVATWQGWQLTPPGAPQVGPLGIVLVCLLVGAIAALGAYVASRVTKRPALWVAVAGIGLFLASLRGLPPALVVMHTITALWVVGWLVAAVRGRSHLTATAA